MHTIRLKDDYIKLGQASTPDSTTPAAFNA